MCKFRCVIYDLPVHVLFSFCSDIQTLLFFYFLQMVEKGTSLLKRMEISVAEAEKRTGKNAVNMQETYTVYLIETRYFIASFFHAVTRVNETRPVLNALCDVISFLHLCCAFAWCMYCGLPCAVLQTPLLHVILHS